MQKNGFSIKGTTDSNFTGVQEFKAGKLAYRSLGGEQYRIRVATTQKLTFDPSWKTPSDGQPRYSVVVNGLDNLVQNVAAAARVLAAASIVEVPATPAVAAVQAHLAIA